MNLSTTQRRLLTILLSLVILLATLFLGAWALVATGHGGWYLERAMANITRTHTIPRQLLEQGRENLHKALDTQGALRLPLANAHVVIHKGDRRIELFDGEKLLRSYRCVLGRNPKGDKEKKGDGRTPEGTFHIRTRLFQSRYGLFMGLSWPLADDAERGRREELITDDQAQAIIDAHRNEECPPWDTPLGGAIGIHGGGANRDWTAGCIAVDDEDVAEIWLATEQGTPVTIRP